MQDDLEAVYDALIEAAGTLFHYRDNPRIDRARNFIRDAIEDLEFEMEAIDTGTDPGESI